MLAWEIVEVTTLELWFYKDKVADILLECFAYNSIITCLFCLLGPLVFTDKNGKTTLHGVVSAGGNKGPVCLSTALFVRVADPSILKWIKNKMDINR